MYVACKYVQRYIRNTYPSPFPPTPLRHFPCPSPGHWYNSTTYSYMYLTNTGDLGLWRETNFFFFFSSLAFLSIPPQKGPASYRRPTPIYFNSPTIPTLAYSPSHIPSPPIPQFPIHLSARVSVLPSLPFFFLIPVASRVWNIIRLKNFRAFLLRGKS